MHPIIGLDGGDNAAETQARKDRLRQRNGFPQSRYVVARLRAQQEPHRTRAVGKGCGDCFKTHLRRLVDRKWKHMRRQSVTVSPQRVDQVGAVSVVMQQHDRAVAARLAIGCEQRTQLPHQRVGRRQRVAGGAGRTGRGALSAAGAYLCVDGDVVAVWRDRAGRAQIETAVAADDPGA
jgi:hypothetical protein